MNFEVFFPTPLANIKDPANDNVDVCVKTQDGKCYTLVFVTPDNLKTLMESVGESYIHPDFKFVIVKQISKENIISALNEITKDLTLLQQLGGD